MILFAIGMGFVAAVLFGLTPALQVGRQRVDAFRMRGVLIGAQVAASCVLLIVAGLLTRAAAYLSALGVFAVAVALAAWLPARRAQRVDPMRALRCE